MKTNNLAETARKFISRCNEIQATDTEQDIDLTEIINSLAHVKVSDGYSVHGIVRSLSNLAGVSLMYACRQDSLDKDDKWFSHITAEPTEEGIWEYFLACEINTFLPLFHNGEYIRHSYVLDADTVPEMLGIPADVQSDCIECLQGGRIGISSKVLKSLGFPRLEDITNAVALRGDSVLLPSVVIDGKIAEITYVYVSWDGRLIRERLQWEIVPDGINFQDPGLRVCLVNRKK